jgi:16S rRNA (guanine527-N7)-methyltransferase
MDDPTGVSNQPVPAAVCLEGLLAGQSSAAGLPIDDTALGPLSRYLAFLLEQNARHNLTGLKSPEKIVSELFLDSLALERWLTETGLDGPLVDVGSGAGFPGVVVAILRPGEQVALVEATGKKARFLETVRAELALENVRVLHGRSEDLARRDELRAIFRLATARGLTALPAVLELTLPFLQVGGSLVAVKGPNVQAEVEASAGALEVLGGRLLTVATPPGRPGTRLVHVILERHVPEAYPRRAGVPTKRPLQG